LTEVPIVASILFKDSPCHTNLSFMTVAYSIYDSLFKFGLLDFIQACKKGGLG